MEETTPTIGTLMDSVSAALVNGLTEVAVGMGDVIGAILPIALAVMSGVLVVSFGIKLFKKVTGR